MTIDQLATEYRRTRADSHKVTHPALRQHLAEQLRRIERLSWVYPVPAWRAAVDARRHEKGV